jgi:DNA polymerase-3 subunit epsilon
MQGNSFVVIDVETANYDVSSICQIGAVRFSNNEIVDEFSTLINPETFFESINVDIHGITSGDVKDSPKFSEVYDKLLAFFSDKIILTYTAFDRSSINQAISKYALNQLPNSWLDCAKVVRRFWPEFAYSGYGLKNVANFAGIKFKHHDALEDARAAGLIFTKILQDSNQSIIDWVDRCKRKITIQTPINLSGNPEGQLFGETIVFTGALNIPRREAAVISSNAGCNVKDNVNKETTILVVGELDKSRLAGFEKSSKQRKAEELILKGHELRILSERDFYDLVDIEKINFQDVVKSEKELIFSGKEIVVDSYQANKATYDFLKKKRGNTEKRCY